MRTYRLQFSPDETIFRRRLEKAKLSGAERVLVSGLKNPETHKTSFQPLWATEIAAESFTLADWSNWDQLHYVISDPRGVNQRFNLRPQDIWVLQPQRFEIQPWVNWLSQFTSEELNEKVFLEFSPWSLSRPQGLTVHEVSRFLHSIQFHFPDWTPKRRPGVEMWDPRIPESLELEAGSFSQDFFNWKYEDPEISVVIPTFNNKYFVYQTLKHLSLQKFSQNRFEVILIDDGGADETLEYLRIFGVPRDLQLRYVYWPRSQIRNRGDSFFRAGLSRNLGVRLSRSADLVFLDSDILVSPNFLQEIKEHLNFFDVLQFPRHHIYQEKSHANTQYQSISKEDLYIEEEHYWKLFFQSKNWMSLQHFWKYTCTYAMALRKRDFLKAGGFKRFYVSYGFEDTELGYHLAKMNKKFHLVDDPVLHLTSYSQSEYQLSQEKRRKLLKKTAKQFFLSTLDLEVYYQLRGLMVGDFALLSRFRTYFGSKDKTKYHDAST